MQNFGLKPPIFEKFKSKIKILSTHDLPCRKFAAVCCKTANFFPTYFFKPAMLLAIVLCGHPPFELKIGTPISPAAKNIHTILVFPHLIQIKSR